MLDHLDTNKLSRPKEEAEVRYQRDRRMYIEGQQAAQMELNLEFGVQYNDRDKKMYSMGYNSGETTND